MQSTVPVKHFKIHEKITLVQMPYDLIILLCDSEGEGTTKEIELSPNEIVVAWEKSCSGTSSTPPTTQFGRKRRL